MTGEQPRSLFGFGGQIDRRRVYTEDGIFLGCIRAMTVESSMGGGYGERIDLQIERTERDAYYEAPPRDHQRINRINEIFDISTNQHVGSMPPKTTPPTLTKETNMFGLSATETIDGWLVLVSTTINDKSVILAERNIERSETVDSVTAARAAVAEEFTESLRNLLA